jgi:hypothetical protein
MTDSAWLLARQPSSNLDLPAFFGKVCSLQYKTHGGSCFSTVSLLFPLFVIAICQPHHILRTVVDAIQAGDVRSNVGSLWSVVVSASAGAAGAAALAAGVAVLAVAAVLAVGATLAQ